jgi:uncharacterized paraquat-inducible protein A
MSSCPKCGHRIGLRSILQATSLTCPQCKANLRAEFRSSLLLMLLSLAAGVLAENFARRAGATFPWDLLALLGAFGVVYLGLATRLLRFRLGQESPLLRWR